VKSSPKACPKPAGVPLSAAGGVVAEGVGSGTVETFVFVSGTGLVCAIAAPPMPSVNIERTNVGSVRCCKILPPCSIRGGEKLIHAEHGVQIELRVPRRVPPQEELQPRTRLGSKRRIILEFAVELLL